MERKLLEMEQAQRLTNRAELLQGINDNVPEALEKLERVRRNSPEMSIDALKHLVRSHTWLQDMVGKQVSRQSLAERCVADILESTALRLGGEARKLPTNGPNALYLYNGQLCSRHSNPEAVRFSSSLDFVVSVPAPAGQPTEFYISHKHTREQGGSQKHQFTEVQQFLQRAGQVRSRRVRFIALVDGAYYHTRRAGSNHTRLEELRALCARGAMVLTTEEFTAYLEGLQPAQRGSLTWGQEQKALACWPTHTFSEIGALFNVTRNTIAGIYTRRGWPRKTEDLLSA